MGVRVGRACTTRVRAFPINRLDLAVISCYKCHNYRLDEVLWFRWGARAMENDRKNGATIVLGGRPLRRLCAVIATTLAVVCVLMVGPAPAGPLMPDDHCGEGDVTAIMHAYYPLWSTGWGDPLNAPNLCQFRTFYEPPEGICFCEHDMFVGGDVWSESCSVPLSRVAGRATRAASSPTTAGRRGSRSSLEEEVTTFIEPAGLPIDRFVTPVRGWTEPGGGRLVLKQTGAVFRDLPPGTYTISTALHHPAQAIFGNLFGEPWLVTFRVLPHDQAHALGRPTGEFPFGSVKCPADID